MEFLYGAVEARLRPRFFHTGGRRSTGIPKLWPRAVEAHLRPRFFQLAQILFLWHSARPTLGVLVANSI